MAVQQSAPHPEASAAIGLRRKKTRRGGLRGPAVLRQRAKRGACPEINREIVEEARCGTLESLLEVVGPRIPEMNLVNLATALHRIAKLAAAAEARLMVQRHPIMRELSAATASVLAGRMQRENTLPQSQALSSVAWALATLEYVDLPLLSVAATVIMELMAEFKLFELSNVLWAFARLGQLDAKAAALGAPLFAGAAPLVLGRSERRFHLGCLATALRAFATAGHLDAGLFRGLGRRVTLAVREASCQDLVDIVWAYSVAGVHHEELFEEVALEVSQRIGEFRPSELRCLLASCAGLGLLEANAPPPTPTFALRPPVQAADAAPPEGGWAVCFPDIHGEKLSHEGGAMRATPDHHHHAGLGAVKCVEESLDPLYILPADISSDLLKVSAWSTATPTSMKPWGSSLCAISL